MYFVGAASLQQFYYFFTKSKLHYTEMSQKQIKQTEEHDLLGSLLEDIDDFSPTAKNGVVVRSQALSAPPVFSELSYKLQFDFLESSTFESPDPEDRNIMEAFFKKQSSPKSNVYPLSQPHQAYRKMSCDSSLYSYRQNNIQPDFDYYSYMQPYSPLEDLFMNLDRVAEWSRDQNGSRTVQEIFDTESDERKDQIFNVIFPDSLNLCTDRFGNYVLQKIFDKGLINHKQMLINSMWGSINSLGMNSYGCRVIQKALEYIKGKQDKQDKFMSEITHNITILIENQNGNHVIQKCFEVLPHKKVYKIFQVLKKNLNSLAYHTYGCRVIQKYLQNYSTQKQCVQILETLLEQTISLSQCQFGNYVMQHIVTKCKQERKKVFKYFLQRVYQLSTNKYASNVMQKAIQAPESHFCETLADWFSNNLKDLVGLAKHQYGNYVVQSMVMKLPCDKKTKFRTILRQNTSQISKSQHGRHVLLQLQHTKNK